MINLYLIVAVPVIITLAWGILFVSTPQPTNRARFVLGLFMLTAAVLYATHALFFLKLYNIYLAVDSIYALASLSVFPFYYCYIKLLSSETSFKLFNILHFTPAIIVSLLLELLMLNSPQFIKQAYLQNVLIDNNWQSIFFDGKLGWISRVYFLSRIVFGAQALYYLFTGYQLVSLHNFRIKNFYSNLTNRELIWIKLSIVIFLLTSLLSVVANFTGRGLFTENKLALTLASITFSSMLFLIGLVGYKQVSTTDDMASTGPHNRNNLNYGLDEVDYHLRTLIRENLTHLLKAEKLYLNSDLKISDISKRISVDNQFLSAFIIEEYGDNFNDYINRHRIVHAKKLIKNNIDKILTMEEIAKKSGFDSVNAFTRIYKSLEGEAPLMFAPSK